MFGAGRRVRCSLAVPVGNRFRGRARVASHAAVARIALLRTFTPNRNSTASMKTEEIANRLVALCREQKWETAQKELYAQNAVSIEPHETPGFPKETRGLAAIEEKGRQWASMVETMHAFKVSDPIVAGNAFACTMELDMTMKGQGRMKVSELCVYQVQDAKIVAEQFFM
jgi:hypothetical protein